MAACEVAPSAVHLGSPPTSCARGGRLLRRPLPSGLTQRPARRSVQPRVAIRAHVRTALVRAFGGALPLIQRRRYGGADDDPPVRQQPRRQVLPRPPGRADLETRGSVVSACHGLPRLRGAHDQRLSLRPVQPRLPSSGTQPGPRPAGMEKAQQAGHRRPRRALRMVVSRLRRPSTSVGRSDQRPQGSAGAGWRAARRDERALPRMQHAQALGTDADAASTALTCSDGRDGLARPCSSPDGAALTKPNGVTALTGGDDVERAASNWGRIKSADLCGD